MTRIQKLAAWLLIAASAGAYAASASDPPAPGASVSKRGEQPAGKQPDSKATVDQRGKEAAPAIVRVILPESSETEARKAKYESDEKPALDRWTVWIAGVSAVVNTVLALFTFLLWRDARRTAEASAQDTRDSLKIAQQSADAATASSVAVMAAERGRLYVKNVRILPAGKDRTFPAIAYSITNVGRTPAIVNSVPVGFGMGELPEPRGEIVPEFHGRRYFIPPGGSITNYCSLPDATWQELDFFYGEAHYVDIHGREHVSGFAFTFGDDHSPGMIAPSASYWTYT